MAKKRGLGRDLNSLLGDLSTNVSIAGLDTVDVSRKSELRRLPIECLQQGQFQPRKDINSESLEELAGSIKTQGIIQPIVVRPITDSTYEIIAGERRWRAAQLAGLEEIPALVRHVNDETAVALALIENIQREDLNPIEEAVALQRLLEEFNMTHQEVAESVGKSRSAVTNLLRLLKLVPSVRTLLERKDLEMGHARALLALEDSESQRQAAQTVVARELSVRETEKLVKRFLTKGSINKATQTIDPDIKLLQNELADKLGAKLSISHNKKGKGKLVIYYNSVDELEGILEHIR
ncbi:MAG: ParB/RepB/Spo0J family partition protein [Candidatus Neomarinimicrobiota bacterium]